MFRSWRSGIILFHKLALPLFVLGTGSARACARAARALDAVAPMATTLAMPLGTRMEPNSKIELPLNALLLVAKVGMAKARARKTKIKMARFIRQAVGPGRARAF